MPMLPLHPLTHLHSSTIYPPSLHYSFIHSSVHPSVPSSNKAYQQAILIHTAMLPLPKCSFCLPSFDTNSSSIAREANGTPLQYSCLENPMDGGAWQASVQGVAKSQTRLSDFTFTFHFCALEKEMVTHSSVLDWRIPGTGEPGELLSMGLHRVRHS